MLLRELTRSPRIHLDPDRRWYYRLYGDDYTDLWLISWVTEQATELHDHAGSLGALTVVAGELLEQRWTNVARQLRSRRSGPGSSVGFPLAHVHDVINPWPAPAVSVHAYSPPLTAMSYYDVQARGRLRRTRTVLTGNGRESQV